MLIGGSVGRIIERLTMRLPDGIVAISQKTRIDLIKRGKVRSERIDVIPVGIDLERIVKIAPAREILTCCLPGVLFTRSVLICC